MTTLRLLDDQDAPVLLVDSREFDLNEDVVFEVPAKLLKKVRLSELPPGARIRLCDTVVGSSDLVARSPYCVLERSTTMELLGHLETAFFAEDEELAEDTRKQHLKRALTLGKNALVPIKDSGIVVDVRESVFDEIAHLTVTLRLNDQETLDAEYYLEAIEARLHDELGRSRMFICHASEDKPFVERLVEELDRHALHAWYDSREILVGDSIVEEINKGLAHARFLLAILSPRSVAKPWVQRELNSTLMRQLGDNAVRVLPVLLEDCALPPLFADIKYADFRGNFEEGFETLLAAVRRSDP